MTLKKSRGKALSALRRIGVAHSEAAKIIKAIRQGRLYGISDLQLSSCELHVIDHSCNCGVRGCMSFESYIVSDVGRVEVNMESVGGFDVA